MATKKVSAKTVVAEQPVKTAKVAKTTKPVATATAAPAKKAAPAKPAVATKAAAPVSAKKAAAPKAKSENKVVTAKKAVVATSKVSFSLPKEAVVNAETVAVLGDFNNWQNGTSLKKQKDGSFTTSIELEKGRSYEFRFLINGEKWENAWNAEAYKPTPFGGINSVVTV